MPISDFWIVLRWWGALFLVGAAAFPVTSLLFARWYDRGYLFSKAVGMVLVSWFVFAAGITHLAPFTNVTVAVSLGIIFLCGVIGHSVRQRETYTSRYYLLIFAEELMFISALLFWSWVKAHEPSIRGLEKFMDYGFMNSILHARFFPPADMWYPPYPVNYYYFGHLVTAVLTKLSGLDLSYTFNLMLATIFALCLTMSFSLGYTVTGTIAKIKAPAKILGAILTAFLVTLAGNMQTIYAFTKGYTGDNVKPFWQLLWPLTNVWQKLPEGMNTYWYANATRFIPYTIHEFPSYSFVVSDVHGHVLSIPFVLLAIGFLVVMFGQSFHKRVNHELRIMNADWLHVGFYGFLCGALLMTNALDGPIYLGLFLVFLLVLYPGDWRDRTYWLEWGKIAGIVVVAAILTSLPFLLHFKSFVNGIAVDCPPKLIANTHIGPLLFEGVEKCQKSPFWMMYLLWGFFWFNGAWLMLAKLIEQRTKNTETSLWRLILRTWNAGFSQMEKVLVIFFFVSLGLIVFPEFFYFKDIYPMHFRSNTMFKLGYQVFILSSVLSGYTILNSLHTARKSVGQKIYLLLLLPQLFFVSIYPLFSVRSYFGQLRTYEGIWGLGWLAREYPDNYSAIQWLNSKVGSPTSSRLAGLRGAPLTGLPVIVEADGDSYTDYNQFSVFTGSPTVVGWAVHEWLWRGTYDVVSPRREEVRKIYESEDLNETKSILANYGVRYIIVGALERQKFTKLEEQKFSLLGHEVYRSGTTVIYERGN